MCYHLEDRSKTGIKWKEKGIRQRKQPIGNKEASASHKSELSNEKNTEHTETWESNLIKTESEKIKEITSKCEIYNN